MKTRTLITRIAALFLATGTAHAQSLWTFRPPPEYDHPFDGLVMVQRASAEYIKKFCPSVNSMACSISELLAKALWHGASSLHSRRV